MAKVGGNKASFDGRVRGLLEPPPPDMLPEPDCCRYLTMKLQRAIELLDAVARKHRAANKQALLRELEHVSAYFTDPAVRLGERIDIYARLLAPRRRGPIARGTRKYAGPLFGGMFGGFVPYGGAGLLSLLNLKEHAPAAAPTNEHHDYLRSLVDTVDDERKKTKKIGRAHQTDKAAIQRIIEQYVESMKKKPPDFRLQGVVSEIQGELKYARKLRKKRLL
jgi:hypothetical protein